jgi:hypothetical protein
MRMSGMGRKRTLARLGRIPDVSHLLTQQDACENFSWQTAELS